MFANCAHGYIAMTCPQCNRLGSPLAAAPRYQPAPAVSRSESPHYSGAPMETRRALADSWEDIVDRTISRVDRSSFQHGVQSGALKRREISI